MNFSLLKELLASDNTRALSDYLTSQAEALYQYDEQGYSALYYLLRSQHRNIIIDFISKGNTVTEVDKPISNSGLTLLYIAAYYGYLDVVKALLDKGADKDKGATANAATPLIAAADEGLVDTVELLLKYGADKDKGTTDNGATPLLFAAGSGRVKVVEMLLKHGADKDKATTNYGVTPLHKAAAKGQVDVVKVLLAYGADIHLRCHRMTPLFLATKKNKVDVVTLLAKAPETTLKELQEPASHRCVSDEVKALLNNEINVRLEIAQEQDEKCGVALTFWPTCPISLVRIFDPVVASDGQTYDRAWIKAWQHRANTSPTTGLEMRGELYDDFQKKANIEKICHQVDAFYKRYREKSWAAWCQQIRATFTDEDDASLAVSTYTESPATFFTSSSTTSSPNTSDPTNTDGHETENPSACILS